MLNQAGVYSITNKSNGKRYIGSAVNLGRRFEAHKNALRVGRHHNTYLQNSFVKYGEASFEFKPLLICEKKDLIFFEQRTIDALNACATGYNKCPLAGSALGIKRSEETKVKMSAAQAGRVITEEHRKKLSVVAKGRPGRKHTAEAKSRMSALAVGNKHALGHRHSEGAKSKISAAKTGHTITKETRDKLSFSGKLVWASKRDRSASPETKKRMRAAWVLRRAAKAARECS